MTHIRDLQKLRGTKPIQRQPFDLPPGPQFQNFLFQQPSARKNNREHLRVTPVKSLHRRGGSQCTPQLERRTFNLVQNPRLSIYNFSLKLNADRNRPEQQQEVEFPEAVSTQRRSKPAGLRVLRREPLPLNKSAFNVLLAVGKGGFGKVWKVQHRKSQKVWAMKEMSKAKVINKKSVSSVLNERTFLAKLQHPFLVNMNCAFQDREHLYLIMDYLDGGDLRYHIGNRQFFSQRQTKFFVANIVLALQYMHRCRLIHRDLKPENLVFDSQGYLRLTDLGISRELREDNYHDTSGTPGYMAPEVMNRQTHTYAVDFFALGVIAFELMLAKRPYMGANRKEIKEAMLARQAGVRVDQLPFRWSPHVIDFINRLLMRNPAQRLGSKGIDEIKDHPWLSDIQWEKLLNKKVKSPFKPLSIEEDYDNYKEQISEDTINDNEEEIHLLLRRGETQELFEGYHYERSEADRKFTFSTRATEEGQTQR